MFLEANNGSLVTLVLASRMMIDELRKSSYSMSGMSLSGSRFSIMFLSGIR